MAFNERLSYLQSSEEGHHNVSYDINPCKNLSDIFNSLDAVNSEHLKVFLRVRPTLHSEEEDTEEKNIEIQDAKHVLVTAPASSHAFKNRPYGATKFTQRFTFTHVYSPNSSQKQLFDDTTRRLVKELIDGQNCLLFSYGATNSGKTHTIQGLPSNPGVLPRSLEFLFQCISNQQYKGVDLKPQHFCGVVRLSEKEIFKEQEHKEAIFRLATDPGSLYLSKSNLSLCSTLSKESEQDSQCSSLNDATKISEFSPEESAIEGTSSDCIYAAFVSFAEIYNENIYDLLERPSLLRKGKRTPLALGEDREGAIYIKGLREFRVTSIEEALQILEAGRQSLHFASTLLNHHSSRSHCIFTVKLIRLAHPENPHIARVSMLSLCDLAGTERAGKTLNSQDRLKEASNINTSLLVLGRCIAALRQNQFMQKQNCGPKRTIPVPYRDSKVTRLFQSFFMGRGNMAMIVNIGTSNKLFDETLKVLKFSALAQKVAIIQEKGHLESLEESRRNTQFVRMMRQSYNMSTSSGRLSVPWANSTRLSEVTFGGNEGNEMSRMGTVAEEEDEDNRMGELLDLIRRLKEKLLQESKEKLELEAKLRKELCEDFGRKLVEIEDSWRNRVQEERVRAEDYMDWRVNHLLESVKKGPSGCKRMRKEDPDQEEETVPSIYLVREELKVQELQNENNLVQEELIALKNSLKSSNQNLRLNQMEVSKLTFQLAQLTTSYDKVVEQKSQLETSKANYHHSSINENGTNLVVEELQAKNESLRHLADEKDNEIREIKVMLDEAAEEFIDKEQKISSLRALLTSEKEKNTKQSLTLSELESQLSGAEQMVANQGHLLEEREHAIFELRQVAEARNVKSPELVKKESDLCEVKLAMENSESYRILEVAVEEKDAVILELEEECCSLSDRISSLEENEKKAEDQVKIMEGEHQKQFQDEQEANLLKFETIQNSLKDLTEEKELLLFKTTELELEVKTLNTSLNEANNKSANAHCALEKKSLTLQEGNEKLKKRLQNLEELVSLKELSECELHRELQSMREAHDRHVMDKLELESKFEMATHSEDSLKKKIINKEEELNKLIHCNDQLESALQRISSLEASKGEVEDHLKTLESELLKYTDSEERLKKVSDELESKLRDSLQGEKELRCSHLKMEARTKALSDVKDDLIAQNRLLESKLVKSDMLMKELQKDMEMGCQKSEEREAASKKSLEDRDSEITSLTTDLESIKTDKHSIELQNADLTSKVIVLTQQIEIISEEKTRITNSSKGKEDKLVSDFEKLKHENNQLLKFKESLRESTVNEQALTSEKEMLLIKIPDLEKRLEAKGMLASKLVYKIESLDKKLSVADEECMAYRAKCECLEKEVNAVRSARLEEVSQLQTAFENNEASVSLKEEEISTLQQEIKRLLQSSTISDASERSMQINSNIKKEHIENEKIISLEDKLRENELEKSNLLLKLSSLEDQLQEREQTFQESILAANSLIIPPKSNKKPTRAAMSDLSEQDTHATRTRGKKKTQEKLFPNYEFQPQTPGGESLTLVFEGSDVETPSSSVSKTRSTRATTKVIYREDSLEENCFKAPMTRKKTADPEAEEANEDDVWKPSADRKTRSTRKTKTRRTTKVENPHLENKENLHSSQDPVASDSKDVTTGTKARPRGKRRPLYNAESADTFDFSPNLIELESHEQDSPDTPHTIVRRQLRRRK